MNTTENNKIIAKFMNWEEFNKFSMIAPKSGDDVWNFENMKFDSDWNWLMEVVEKIENFRISDSQNSMRFDVKINHHSCRINDWEIEGKNFIHIGGCHSKIEAVYYACLEFVRWCNQQYKNIENAQKEI